MSPHSEADGAFALMRLSSVCMLIMYISAYACTVEEGCWFE